MIKIKKKENEKGKNDDGYLNIKHKKERKKNKLQNIYKINEHHLTQKQSQQQNHCISLFIFIKQTKQTVYGLLEMF